jgi:hypothetical protein
VTRGATSCWPTWRNPTTACHTSNSLVSFNRGLTTAFHTSISLVSFYMADFFCSLSYKHLISQFLYSRHLLQPFIQASHWSVFIWRTFTVLQPFIQASHWSVLIWRTSTTAFQTSISLVGSNMAYSYYSLSYKHLIGQFSYD